MTRLSLTTTAVAALLALALPAAAAPFQVEKQGSTAHGAYGSVNTTLSKGGSVSSGAFAVKADEFGGNFAAWCLDLANTLNLPSSYEITSTPFAGNTISTAVQTTVKALFDTAYSTLNLNNKNQSAGFQLALWEILTETKTNKGKMVYELGSTSSNKGVFYATNNSTTSDAIKAANGFLKGLNGTKTGDYTLTFLQSTDGKQSMVTVAQPVPPPPSEVPLPAAGLLLVGALGGLGVVARRRKSTEA